MVMLGTPIRIVVRATTNKVSDDINRGLRSARGSVTRNGEDLGRAFSEGFNRGTNINAFRRVSNGIREMVPEADRAKAAFTGLIRTGYTLQTALTMVVGGISSVISSLGALIGSAAGAASTVAVLGNGLFALGAGMIASRLALGGVGKALTALNKQNAATAGTSSRTALQVVRDSQARENAARRIEDAERSLARVVERNRERIISANNAVAESQRDLTQAFREGREEIQQVGFDAEDAALSEKRAAAELEDARLALQGVQDLPPNSRARREAELAYQEAELNYRKAQDASADASAEQQRLARTGVNGTKAVIAARKQLADAETDRVKAVKDAAQDEADAVRDVADARREAANVDERQDAAGGGDGPAAAAALGAAWDDGLNEAQRKFVLFLASLKPKFDELSRIASEAFLPKLQTAIEILMDRAFPTVAYGIGIVAGAMGDAAIKLAEFITTGDNLAGLNSLFESSARLIGIFADIVGHAYGILLNILEATAPMAERFFGWLAGELKKFDDFLNTTEGNQSLVDFFGKAEAAAKLFGDIFGNVFRGIGGIIDANLGEGTGGFILLEKLRDMSSGWGNSKELEEFFVNVANNATHVLGVVTDLLGILGRVGENQAIGQAFEKLREAGPDLEALLQTAADAAPSFAELLVTLTDIANSLSDTGAMTVFFDTLNGIAELVADFVADPANKAFMDFFGRIFAFFSAIGVATGIVGFAFKVLAGGILAILKPFALLTGVMRVVVGVKAGFTAATYGAVGATYAMTAAQKLGVLAYKAQQAAIKGAQLVMIAWNGTITAVKTGMMLLRTGTLATTAQIVAQRVATVAMSVAQKAAAAAQWLFNAALNANPIGLIITAITALVGGLIYFFTQTELGKEVWQNVTKIIGDAVTWLWEDILQPAFKGIGDLFGWLYENVIAPVGKGIADVFVWLWENGIKLVVDFIVGYIKAWATTITWLWENVISPVIGFIGAAFKWVWETVIKLVVGYIVFQIEAWGNVINWLWTNVIQPVFKLIGDLFNWIWNNVIQPVIGFIRDAIETLGRGFKILYETYVQPAMQGVSDLLASVWKFIQDNVFAPWNRGIEAIGTAFEVLGRGIGIAMDGIRKAAADPVNFMIDTVYNKGIRSFWNDIAGNLGLNNLKLNTLPTIQYASGGVLPGYTPGRDVHDFYSRTAGRLRLSGGEAIMRPEWTRAVGGPAAVARMNAAAIKGQAFASGGVFNGGGVPTRSYATGGVVDFVGDLLDNVAQIAMDFFADPKGAVEKHLVNGLIKPLLGGNDSSPIQKLVGGLPIKAASFISEAIGNLFGSDAPANGGGDAPANAMGWQRMWGIVKNALPGAVMTSNYRPGSMTVNGTPSYHGSGRAIDVIPATMDTFNKMLQLFPNARELIYTPAGGRQLLNGKPFGNWSAGVKAQHYNHVHVAMANGGVVSPSPNGTIARIAEAGQAERVEPLDRNGISERDKAWAREFGAGQGNTVINITVEKMPQEDSDEFAEKVSKLISKNMRKGR